MKPTISLIIWFCLVSCCFSLSISEVQHDKYLHELKREVKGDYQLFYKLCGTNDVYSITGDAFLTEGSPYKYYVLDPDKFGQQIKAVSRTGKRTYIQCLNWNVCFYDFVSDEELKRFGNSLIEWSEDNLTEGEQQQFLHDLEWRGLYTPSEDPRFALGDVLGTSGKLILHDEIRPQIWNLIQSDHLSRDGKEKILRSIVSLFETYPEEIRGEVISNIKKSIDTNFKDGSRWYVEKIRTWLRDQGVDAPSILPPPKPKDPNDLFGD